MYKINTKVKECQRKYMGLKTDFFEKTISLKFMVFFCLPTRFYLEKYTDTGDY